MGFKLFCFRLACILCLPCIGINTFGQRNICIDSVNDPEEVSLSISPKNPAHIVAGANITCFYYSSDTGRSWKGGFMKSPYGVWGDPIILSDTDGNFYFFHLSTPADGHWLDRMVCQKSTDGGQAWSDGTYTGLNGDKNQDKPGCTIDLTHSPYRNRLYITWTQFDHYHSTNPKDSSRILFSYSPDEGKTWSKPMRIDSRAGDCLDGDNTNEGAVPAVGPDGQVYVSWAGPEGLVFNKSLDGGKTWLPHEERVSHVIGGWDYYIPGIDRCDGLPATSCDISKGPHRGTIYINWSDQRNGLDNTDVWIVKSVNEGKTWSKPLRINNDEGSRQQFMSWCTVDPANGYLYCLYYDRRNNRGDTTDVYLAVSRDGGDSFVNFRVNDRYFVPNAIDFFGDYISVQARDGIIRPMWMQLNKHKLSIWTALLNGHDLDWAMYKPLPNACATKQPEMANENESIWFTYKLENEQNINLSVVNMWGRTVCKIYTQKHLWAGNHEYLLDLAHRHIPAGVYAYKLDTEDGTIYKPFVIY